MSVILIDKLKTVVFYNGVLRIDCVTTGPNGEERSAGTLLIPGNQAGPILKSLANAMQDLEHKMREQQAQKQPTAGTA